ncbi:MAG TPA: hypothetical protein ENN53_06970 [Candidatus Acetothermia bacterium]|mgnify:CR=1 FL=1|nr:hypothetical protein [Candidatus Acetothermia bacterium]
MASEVHVAFLWHMHQPWYALPGSAENLLPWTRLRAAKDYTDMAAWLERWTVPVTVNFTPSLTEQLRRYAAGTLTDAYLPSCAGPHALAELRSGAVPLPIARRGLPAPDPAALCGDRSPDGERRLWGWFLLAWIGQSVLEADPDLRALWERGSFSSAEVAALEERQRGIVAEVVPRYRRLAEDAGIELTATPFYHPILPLLLDTAAARRSQPHDELPPFSAPDDAREQVRRALNHHATVFGRRPNGMWPAEGAVSTAAAGLLAGEGVRWIVTDGGILARSLGRAPSPEELHRPWRFRTGDGEIIILFRDTHLSNLIGFDYHRWPPAEAARDLLQRLRRNGTAWHGARPPLVLIAMDGENAWEFYDRNGRPFFESLYRQLRDERPIVPTTISGYLDRFGVEAVLGDLWSGSWIDADFRTWIGHPSQNAGWEQLARAQAAAAAASPGPGRTRAHDHLLIAEGSDWFWWYGPRHSSPHEPVFDRLFRARLAQVYAEIGRPIPSDLVP